VIVEKEGFGDSYLHTLCSNLDRALKSIHRRWQAEHPDTPVEMVEVKGHPPRVEWGDNRTMKSIVSGQFAKLPRQLDTRLGEFRRTTVLDEFKIKAICKRAAAQPVVLKLAVPAPEVKPKGSLSGSIVGRDTLDQFQAYLAVAGKLISEPIRTSGRDLATAEDLAILLMILEACSLDMNEDGSMPTARIMRNWECLYENGDVSRPWNPKRYSAMRNMLSEQGLIDWRDKSFVPRDLSPTGKGQAAKWRASGRLLAMISSEKEGGEEDLYGDSHEEVTTMILELNSKTSPEGDPRPEWLRELLDDVFPRPTMTADPWWMRKAG
jgi:hypothetical protein